MWFNFFSKRARPKPAGRLLVSMCNNRIWRDQPKQRVFLVDIDLNSGEVSAIRCPHPDLEPNRGATGLTADARRICYIAQGQPHRLVCMDHQFNITNMLELPELRAIHSIRLHEGQLYAVSTGTDQVVRIDLDTGGIEEKWQAGPVKRDSIHMNSIAVNPESGHLCISAFGPKADTLWSSATKGRVLDIETSETLWSGIYHPHSLTFHSGKRLVCESSHGRVRLGDEELLDVEGGYVRGLAVNNDHLWVGTSVGRTRSESTGQLILNPRDKGVPFGQCSVKQFSRAELGSPATPEQSWDLSEFGEEIYELLLI